MSPKNALLVAAAVAVLGAGVYLFIQVRATPAQASATHVTSTPPRPTERIASTSPTPEVAKAPEEPAPPVPGTTRKIWERPAEEGSDDGGKLDIKSDNMMELASKAYDSQDFDQAVAIAGKVLSKDPNNVRMLRIVVSAHCIQGDSAVAQQHYERLPPFDRDQMKTRCDRYGVVFKDPP